MSGTPRVLPQFLCPSCGRLLAMVHVDWPPTFVVKLVCFTEGLSWQVTLMHAEGAVELHSIEPLGVGEQR